MAKPRTEYACAACGYRAFQWVGRCPGCGAWNAMEAAVVSSGGRKRGVARPAPVTLPEAAGAAPPRRATGVAEFDRVLGGGLVHGTILLIGGDPGIGKSTLLLDISARIGSEARPCLYVSGEESASQVALRAERIGVSATGLRVLAETELDAVLEAASSLNPSVLVVDSVQTVRASPDGIPGQITELREAASRFARFAKETGAVVALIGHVTKDGALAGPKVIEHLVDVVLYFEGERGHSYRVLRAAKNRFGPASEIGVFEMTRSGLKEVPDPSAMFLAERPEGAPGSIVVASAEGQRPLLVEVQALCVDSGLGTPRRTSVGVDAGRVALLLAVLEKRVGLDLRAADVYVNAAGGLRIDEPAVDLGVAAAVAGSLLSRPAQARVVCFGEVGLTGELRAVLRPEARLAEAVKMGFDRCVLPGTNVDRLVETPPGIRPDPASTLGEAIEKILV